MNQTRTAVSLPEKTKIFFSQVRTEMQKVTWPTKDQVKHYTIIVLVSAIVVCIVMGLWDALLVEVIKTFFNVSV
jgi:preprotein translocase subunit SecE